MDTLIEEYRTRYLETCKPGLMGSGTQKGLETVYSGLEAYNFYKGDVNHFYEIIKGLLEIHTYLAEHGGNHRPESWHREKAAILKEFLEKVGSNEHAATEEK